MVLAGAGFGGASAPTASALDAPPNDLREHATVLDPSGTGTVVQSTEGATSDGEVGSCGSMGATVWFRYQTPPNQFRQVIASTRGSDFDTVIALYQLPVGFTPTFPSRCSDDGYLTRSAVSTSASPGQELWFQVGGFRGATGTLRLTISAGGTIRIPVQYADGSPAPAIGLCPELDSQTEQGVGSFSYGAVFPPDGSPPSTLEVRGLPAGAARLRLRSCQFGAGVPELAPVWTPWISVTEGAVTTSPPVVVSPPASLRVVVRNGATGAPAAGVQVNVTPTNPDAPDRFLSLGGTGADGVAVVRGLSGGEYRVAAFFGGPGVPSTIAVVTVAPGTDTAEATITVLPDGFVEGVVTNASGALASGACVTAYPSVSSTITRGTLTSVTGFYRMQVPAGSAAIRFGGDGCGSGSNLNFGSNVVEPVDVPSGATRRVDGTVPGAGVLTGVVIDSSTGQPITSGCVQAFGDADSRRPQSFYASPTGFYRLAGLAPGDKKVKFVSNCLVSNATYATAWAGGGTDEASAAAFPVTAGGETGGADIATRPLTGRLGLLVVDAESGKSVAGSVTVEDGSPTGRFLSADATGRFSALLDPGTYPFRFSPFTSGPFGLATYAPHVGSVTVGDSVVEVTVELRAIDHDGDGLGRRVDNCPFVPNADQADIDADDLGDACDGRDDRVLDADADGIDDRVDNCPAAPNADQQDADGDGRGDPCDADRDGDGAENVADNCPSVANPAQADFDGDGQGDACDPDDDGDGAEDTVDNCAGLANPTQADLDGDGLGDACDADDDGDGVPDATDNCATSPNATQADRDRDGVGDECDPRLGRSTKPPKVK